jgi:hypothetical protein
MMLPSNLAISPEALVARQQHTTTLYLARVGLYAELGAHIAKSSKVTLLHSTRTINDKKLYDSLWTRCNNLLYSSRCRYKVCPITT